MEAPAFQECKQIEPTPVLEKSQKQAEPAPSKSCEDEPQILVIPQNSKEAPEQGEMSKETNQIISQVIICEQDSTSLKPEAIEQNNAPIIEELPPIIQPIAQINQTSKFSNIQHGTECQNHLTNQIPTFDETKKSENIISNIETQNIENIGSNAAILNNTIPIQQQVQIVQVLQSKIEEITTIVKQMKITAKLRQIPKQNKKYESIICFEVQPLYEIQSLLESSLTEENTEENDEWPQSQEQNNENEKENNYQQEINNESGLSNVELKNKRIKPINPETINQDSQKLLQEGNILTIQYTDENLPQQFKVLFETVNELFSVIKSHQQTLFSVDKISQNKLVLNISIFFKQKQFEANLQKHLISHQDFLKRKNNQLVIHMKHLYDKYRLVTKRYSLLKNECKKIEKLQREKVQKGPKNKQKKKKSNLSETINQIEEKTELKDKKIIDKITIIDESADENDKQHHKNNKNNENDNKEEKQPTQDNDQDEDKALTPLQMMRRILKRSLKSREQEEGSFSDKAQKEKSKSKDKKADREKKSDSEEIGFPERNLRRRVKRS